MMTHAESVESRIERAHAVPATAAALALAVRVEEASLNAWPATTQLVLDGWLVRLTQGFTKRANSVIPLYPGSQDLAAKVRFCENLYARERLKTVFRITSIDDNDELDAYLAQRGYRRQDPTEVLYRPIAGDLPPVIQPLQLHPLGTWLDLYARLSGLPSGARPLHESMLRRIALPCCHAAVGTPGDTLACGLAVLEQDLVGLFDVVTREDVRRAGHGRALVAGLLDWGNRQGARIAYLQRVADNLPAAGLYRDLGFHPLYRYWYRISG
jgi:GNAT superfamily N-acetyltransferase